MRAILSLLFLAIAGCVTTHELTISARPTDAAISVDGVSRGRGPITEKLTYAADSDYHTATANRGADKERVIRVGRDFEQSSLSIELKPPPRRVTFTVTPVSGVVSVDGKPIG